MRSLRRDASWEITYGEQINDMVKRGVAKKLSHAEANSYDGPIHYISHHHHFSKSTPVRIVFDSTLQDTV